MTHADNLALIAETARNEPVALVDGIAHLYKADEVEICDQTGAVTIHALAAEISRGLASAEVFGGRAYLRTPMLLPSGASVVVVIEQEGAGRFGITDLGQGYDEAETLGFGRIYRRQAKHVACHQGLAAHQGALAVHDLGPEELTGATMALASAVLRTMERAMRKENRIRSSHQVRTNGRRSRALNEDDIAIVARALRDGNL